MIASVFEMVMDDETSGHVTISLFLLFAITVKRRCMEACASK